MKKTIYFDESGNTGQDLLNSEQKVFALASVRFDNSELEILKSVLKFKGELHFKNLKNTKYGRDLIIKFINHELITEDNIICSVSNKEYVVVAQIVDQLIETYLINNGIDIYKFGVNLSYTNGIYYFGNFFWDKELYSQFLTSFVSMIRKKDFDSIRQFYRTANELYNSVDEKYCDILFPIVESHIYIDEIMEAVSKYTLDVTLSSFLVICDLWYRKTNSKVNVLFDKSKPIEYYLDYIAFCKDLNIKMTEIGYGSRKMFFPAQINELKLVDSVDNFAIQCADLIASTITFMYNNKNKKNNSFIDEIQKSKLLNLSNFHTIWPQPKITAEELDMTDSVGINALDFLATMKINEERNKN